MVFGHHGFGHHHHHGFGHHRRHFGHRGGGGLGVGLLGAGLLAGAAISSSNRADRREYRRQQRQQRQQQRYPPGPWSCPYCTFYNEIYVDRCGTCRQARPVVKYQSQPAQQQTITVYNQQPQQPAPVYSQQVPQPYPNQPQPSYAQQPYPSNQPNRGGSSVPAHLQTSKPRGGGGGGAQYPGNMPRGKGAVQEDSEWEAVWEPDDMRTICPLCSEEFGFFRRKHHCRECGCLICDDCSTNRKRGVRVCDRCFHQRHEPIKPEKHDQPTPQEEKRPALPGVGCQPPLYSEGKEDSSAVPSAPPAFDEDEGMNSYGPGYKSDAHNSFQPGASSSFQPGGASSSQPGGASSNFQAGGASPDMNSYYPSPGEMRMSFRKDNEQLEGR